jgi:WS/DGAT/MGAT family acyltransferase
VAVDRLNADDRLMLEADALWPQDVGAIVILDGASLLGATGGLRLHQVRQAIESRLHLVPRFRQVIHVPRRGLGGPLWTDASDFDVRQHVLVASLADGAGEPEVFDAVENLRRRPLALSRPLWEMWLLPGLAEGRVGLFVRLHHAIADGRAAMTMLGAFLDLDPDASTMSLTPWVTAPIPSPRELVADSFVRRSLGVVHALDRVRHPRSVLAGIRAAAVQTREVLGEGPASKTSLNRLVGPHRRFCVTQANLAEVKEIGHGYGATPNDVLITLTTAGLRAILTGRGESVEQLRVRAYAPVSLRRQMPGVAHGNRISQMVVHLPVDEPDPARRLRRIATETAERKVLPRAAMGAWFRLGFVRRALLRAFARQRVNTVITSVHGPRRPLYLAGARVIEIFPMLNLFGNQTLGVGALSYAGRFFIGVTADKDTYADLDVLEAAMRDELAALRAASESPSTPSRRRARLVHDLGQPDGGREGRRPLEATSMLANGATRAGHSAVRRTSRSLRTREESGHGRAGYGRRRRERGADPQD